MILKDIHHRWRVISALKFGQFFRNNLINPVKLILKNLNSSVPVLQEEIRPNGHLPDAGEGRGQFYFLQQKGHLLQNVSNKFD